MPNQSHIDLLLSGAEQWNRWRAGETGVRPDLRDANLRALKLQKLDLSGAILDGADLTGCILNNCDLTDARLRNANLQRTRLFNVNAAALRVRSVDWRNSELADVRLQNSEIAHADFRDCHFSKCSFEQTSLSDCDFRSSFIGDSSFVRSAFRGGAFDGAGIARLTFAQTPFVQVAGLAAVSHHGPSTIGIDTFFESGGLPEEFLRGAGAPDVFVTYAESLTATAVDLHSCFISYSSNDQEFATTLYNDLQRNSIRAWFAPHDLRIGDRFRTVIDESIHAHDKLLLVLSNSALMSAWVETEVETAFERGRKEHRDVLFPIRIDDSIMKTDVSWAADIRRKRHIGDFTRWRDKKDPSSYRGSFDRLLRDLQPASIVMRDPRNVGSG